MRHPCEAVFFFALPVMMSCAAVYPPLMQIQQSGVRIRAADGSFRLSAGHTFAPPFSSNCSGSRWYGTEADLEEWLNSRDAKAVRVEYPGYSGELYGVLALCEVKRDFHGAASRMYLLEIPQAYIDETTNGRATQVYEKYFVDGEERPAWLLWLSRQPLGGIQQQEPAERREPARADTARHEPAEEMPEEPQAPKRQPMPDDSVSRATDLPQAPQRRETSSEPRNEAAGTEDEGESCKVSSDCRPGLYCKTYLLRSACAPGTATRTRRSTLPAPLPK
jgi:hypothetical protein